MTQPEFASYNQADQADFDEALDNASATSEPPAQASLTHGVAFGALVNEDFGVLRVHRTSPPDKPLGYLA